MRSKGTMLLLALVMLGIYVLPSVTARFAGSHTMEVNTSGTSSGAHNMACGQCHSYIVKELNASALSQDVVARHQAAAGAGGFANNTISDICVFCHTNDTTTISGSHTQVTIKPCDWNDGCHGDSGLTGVQNYAYVTGNLSNSSDVHSGWYNGMTQFTDPLGRASPNGNAGEVLDAGYYTCLGCHSHVGVSFRLVRPTEFQLNLTLNGSTSGWVSVDDVYLGTGTGLTTADATPGSKWN